MMQNYPETFQSLIHKLGADSLACVGELSVEELHEQLGDEVDINDARQVHDEVRRACDRAMLDEKNAIIRHSPLVPESLQPVDDEPVEATARNIALDENWQKERARRYCAPGDVASMFSPAAYLTELYRQAKVLYPEQNPWHIDKRRPDLKQLLLGQENLDTPISALSLSNEILLSRARTAMAMPNTPALSDDQLLEALSTDAGTSGTPYHHHHDRLRQVFVQRDADLSQLLAAPGFARHLDDASLACLRYDLPPTLRRLLTDEINETNAEQKFAEYFPGMTPESMMAPARLRSWFGLPDAELQGFMEALDNAQYKGRTLTTRVGKPEDILKAVAYGFGAQSKVAGLAASRLGQEAHFARRRADWKFQYESAEKQMATVQAQLDALAVRETSAQMHIAHLQTQSAHAQAQLALHQGKFTGKAMYSWLRARLASIFYTYYDLTVSRCLMAQKALQWEKGDTETYLRTGTWNSAWAGLLCGEGLMLSLAQMETAWVKWQKREMEVTRTVSLAQLFDGKLSTQGKAVALGDAVKALLAGRTVEVDAKLERCSLALAAGGVLSIQFGLKALNLVAGFETAASRRIRSIAVSLPALLGPYQDVHARLLTSARGLPAGCEQTSISHALQDNGQFSQLNGYPPLRPGNQLLPFEGLNIAKAEDRNDQTQMTLNFAHAQGEQKALLERLSDIILHVQFTVR